ncbi:hypothetical protein KP509_11G058600 [Ceratopteris richardii]|uniref:Uncharacterized protein n=1 Tax=Ceratopteris richardii TaxID=49495 RepID=A0A8T2TUY7_CERRI|nr:hypothetical protein KP509_11G058600 [Ceratopteris richardii]
MMAIARNRRRDISSLTMSSTTRKRVKRSPSPPPGDRTTPRKADDQSESLAPGLHDLWRELGTLDDDEDADDDMFDKFSSGGGNLPEVSSRKLLLREILQSLTEAIRQPDELDVMDSASSSCSTAPHIGKQSRSRHPPAVHDTVVELEEVCESNFDH